MLRDLRSRILAIALVSCSQAPPGAGHDAGTTRLLDASGAHDGAGAHAPAVDAGSTTHAQAHDAGVPDDTTMPAASGDDLTARMRHLAESIAQDNPELAADVLFPRDAYLAAYDSADPGKTWDRKVGNLFRKQVHTTHKRLKGSDKAVFVSFEIGRAITQVTPKKHDLKRPLWRVKRSKVTLSVDGKEHKVEIAEMLSWRGAWYVAKLR